MKKKKEREMNDQDHRSTAMEISRNSDGSYGHNTLNLELSLRPWRTLLVGDTVLQQPEQPLSHPSQLQQSEEFPLPMESLNETQDLIQDVPQPFDFFGHGDLTAKQPSDVVRKNSVSTPKSRTIAPPYPWATDRPAVVHNMKYLKSKEIFTITGDVKCQRCERVYEIEYDLRGKFLDIEFYIAENKSSYNYRAPMPWSTSPTFPTCKFCKSENGVRPVIPERYEQINWLFMFLGKMLECLTLDHLKYFCKHTRNHRKGAKNRLLYLTYVALCKQLDPPPRDPSSSYG